MIDLDRYNNIWKKIEESILGGVTASILEAFGDFIGSVNLRIVDGAVIVESLELREGKSKNEAIVEMHRTNDILYMRIERK